MVRGHTMEEAQEMAAVYALGALPGEEARAFEQHLAAGCAACAEEVAACGAVVEELAYAVPRRTPRPEVRTRVLERIAAEGLTANHPKVEKEHFLFVSSQWLDWQPGHAPGIEIKLLSFDQERGYYTTLVRMEPGATFPPHRHADVEESYITAGEIWVSDMLMRTGDYCRADAGSLHTGLTTTTGCTFIAVASIRDEWLPLEG